MPRELKSHVHDHCAHHTGYLLSVPDNDIREGGWLWFRTLRGAQRARDYHGGTVFRILSDDHVEVVR